MMDRETILSHTRRGGDVLRYHAWPTLRPQTVADHTWNVLRVWTEMFGPPSQDVFVHALYHDVTELHTGDAPFPFKATNPDVKAAYRRAEAVATVAMGIKPPALSEADQDIFKVCDLVEMMEFGLNECVMGNTLAEPVVQDTLAAAMDICPIAARAQMTTYLRSSIPRLTGASWSAWLAVALVEWDK